MRLEAEDALKAGRLDALVAAIMKPCKQVALELYGAAENALMVEMEEMSKEMASAPDIERAGPADGNCVRPTSDYVLNFPVAEISAG